MAKLYFRYGTVNSAKTLNLLAVAHNYRQQKKNVFLIKPAIDVRFGASNITTRAGLSEKADYLVPESGDIITPDPATLSCILVDEAQFLPIRAVEILHVIAHSHNVPVICYGLRADFRLELFPATQRLFALADVIEEIKTTCYDCDKKAVFNLKLDSGQRATFDGPVVELGCEDKYLPVCANCYRLRHIKNS